MVDLANSLGVSAPHAATYCATYCGYDRENSAADGLDTALKAQYQHFFDTHGRTEIKSAAIKSMFDGFHRLAAQAPMHAFVAETANIRTRAATVAVLESPVEFDQRRPASILAVLLNEREAASMLRLRTELVQRGRNIVAWAYDCLYVVGYIDEPTQKQLEQVVAKKLSVEVVHELEPLSPPATPRNASDLRNSAHPSSVALRLRLNDLDNLTSDNECSEISSAGSSSSDDELNTAEAETGETHRRLTLQAALTGRLGDGPAVEDFFRSIPSGGYGRLLPVTCRKTGNPDVFPHEATHVPYHQVVLPARDPRFPLKNTLQTGAMFVLRDIGRVAIFSRGGYKYHHAYDNTSTTQRATMGDIISAMKALNPAVVPVAHEFWTPLLVASVGTRWARFMCLEKTQTSVRLDPARWWGNPSAVPCEVWRRMQVDQKVVRAAVQLYGHIFLLPQAQVPPYVFSQSHPRPISSTPKHLSM